MPRLSDMLPKSNWIKRADIPQGGLLLIIKAVTEVEVRPGEYKWALEFENYSKLFVLNGANITAINSFCGDGTPNPDVSTCWPGNAIVIIWDPSIEYDNKVVGGMRVRPPSPRELAKLNKTAQPTAAAPPQSNSEPPTAVRAAGPAPAPARMPNPTVASAAQPEAEPPTAELPVVAEEDAPPF